MKKTFTILIIAYIVIALALFIFFGRQKDNEIFMMSIEKDYARLLTDNETIDIPLYISQESTFFTDEANIIDSRIISETDEIKIKIKDIKNKNQRVSYEEKQYFLYYLECDFSEVYSENLKLSIINAQLKLTYENEEVLLLDLGDVMLMFKNLEQVSHIDFNRLYSLHDQDTMVGIYIEIINKTNQSIKIHDVEILNENAKINLNGAKISYEAPNYLVSTNEILKDHQLVVDEFEANDTFNFTHDTSIILPIQYLNEIQHLNRFPLIIHYEYNNLMYTYIIDDYLFYNHISDLYNDYYEVQHYHYSYQ